MTDIESKKFAERLNQAFDLRNYPPHGRGRINYIQEIFHLSRAGANKWVHGKAVPHPQKRIEIAKILGISLDWLEQGTGLPLDKNQEQFDADSLIRKIPLLSMQQAFDIDTVLKKNEMPWLIVSSSVPSNALAVNFVGNSMQPRFHEPCVLIVSMDTPVTDGDYVLAKTNILPEALFRQYIQGSSGIYLVPINTKFESIKLDGYCSIIGKVIEVRDGLEK